VCQPEINEYDDDDDDIPGLCLHSLLGTLSFTLMSHIHLTILISAHWSAISFSFLAGHVIWCLYWSNMKIGSEVWRGGVWKFGFSIDYSILTLYVFSLMCICMLKFFHLSFMFLFKVIWMSFCRSLLVYCKDGLTCHHYDSMNQGNIEAAKRVWNFLRISTKGDYLVFQLYDSIINNIQYSTVQYNTVQYNTVLFPLNVAMG